MTADPALRPGRPKADWDTLCSNHISPLTTSPPPAHLLRGPDLPHERRDVTADIKGLHLAFTPLTPITLAFVRSLGPCCAFQAAVLMASHFEPTLCSLFKGRA